MTIKKIIRDIYLIPVFIYQKTLSHFIGNNCIYEPSCSNYCVGAVRTHGIIYGTLISTWRILRCNPFARGGFDPVPKEKKNG